MTIPGQPPQDPWDPDVAWQQILEESTTARARIARDSITRRIRAVREREMNEAKRLAAETAKLSEEIAYFSGLFELALRLVSWARENHATPDQIPFISEDGIGVVNGWILGRSLTSDCISPEGYPLDGKEYPAVYRNTDTCLLLLAEYGDLVFYHFSHLDSSPPFRSLRAHSYESVTIAGARLLMEAIPLTDIWREMVRLLSGSGARLSQW
jgi:hypothetical protein